jgi:GNAT superfamily N-acetyltransferase
MGRGDIDFALDITSKEGWGFLRKDMERLLALTPGGSFIARLDGARVGLLTTISHQKYCWIGNVAVSPGFRRKGIGRLLVLSALAHARANGFKRMGLISRPGTVGFYEELGFARGPTIIGMAGTPAPMNAGRPDPAVTPVSKELLPQVMRLDSACAGDRRDSMLACFSRDLGHHFLVHLDNGKVDGFIVGKPGAFGMEIGPWTVRRGDSEAARALFFALVFNLQRPVELYIPNRQRWALGFLRELGLRMRNHFVEMSIGGPRRPAGTMQMLALAGLEKG